MFINDQHHWRTAFLVLGVSASLFSLIGFFTIREYQENTTTTKNKSIEKKGNDNGVESTHSPLIELGVSGVFWLISSCYLLWSLVKVGTEDWLQLYLLSDKKLSNPEG